MDVNEDNIQGVGFYKHIGFKVFKRSDLDDYGNPFPILHMMLMNSKKESIYMRRKDREMDRDFGYYVIDKARYGILSVIDDNEPYGVPLSIVRQEENLYFHSAKDGKKVGILANNPSVSVAFVGGINIPENFTEEELKEIVSDESKTILLISSVFTTEYESAVVKGKVEIVEDEEERIQAMRLICEKYSPTKMKYFDVAIKAGLKRTNIYRISIEEIKAKRKRYDKQGKEMKYGRME